MPVDNDGVITPSAEPIHCDLIGVKFSEQLPGDALIMLSRGDKEIAFIAGNKEEILVALSQFVKQVRDSLTYVV